MRVSSATAGVGGPWLEVRLPAGTQVTLTLRLRAGARLPSLRTPWARPVSDAGRRPTESRRDGRFGSRQRRRPELSRAAWRIR